MNVYRVSIQGMHGIEQEEFFSSKESAEKRYTALIEEKKRDKSTLSDEDCEAEGYNRDNFSDITLSLTKQKKHIKTLKSVMYCYGYNVSNEDGTEFYTSVSDINLEQIEVSP